MEELKKPVDEARQQTVLFAQLIEILTQNAIMMLGAMPDRQGRQRPPDLASAEMMIEMLAVLKKKTTGNLTKEEEKMISGTLFQLQTAFADIASKTGEFSKARKATEAAAASEEEAFDPALEDEPMGMMEPDPAQTPNPSAPAPQKTPATAPAAPAAPVVPVESKIKFSKKYT